MTNFSPHTSSSSIGGEARFLMNTHLDVNYSLFESEGDSNLTLEAAKAKCKVCEAEKHLADCILEHQSILLDLWRHHVEVANCHLLNADLNIGRMHMECKKSGIAAFTHSDSGLMIFVKPNACRLVLFVTLVLLMEDPAASIRGKALKDWPKEWYTGAMHTITGVKQNICKVIAIEFYQCITLTSRGGCTEMTVFLEEYPEANCGAKSLFNTIQHWHEACREITG
ncbi:hypothetical protein BDR06DRAFT_976514 [Suillus hirtellus]|nr:hypothetical protein BDR06DRAFT_976514 [Suillus hirtellus]